MVSDVKWGNRLPAKGGWLLCFAAMAALAIGVTPGVASAVTYTYIGSDGAGRSAQADFTFDGPGNLTVRLTNTSTVPAADPTWLLTAVFFDLQGNPVLHGISAVLTPATPSYPESKVYLDNAAIIPQPGVVGGEWSYASGLVQYSDDQGISSSGLGLFSPSGNFPGDNLSGPVSVDGPQYGIAGPTGIATRVHKGVVEPVPALSGTPYIQNAVDFYLSNVPANPVPPGPNGLHVVFQYGTDLAEPHYVGGGFGGNDVPEPATMLAVFLSVAGIGRYLRRRVA